MLVYFPLFPAHQYYKLQREATDSDDYWAMTTPKDLSSDVRSKRTDPSYWDWPTKTKDEEYSIHTQDNNTITLEAWWNSVVKATGDMRLTFGSLSL